jgi:hypothetical protein
MMWHTHAAMGASAALIICCVIGAMVLDVEANESEAKPIKVAGIKPRCRWQPPCSMASVTEDGFTPRIVG